jgi:hypothetical protein
MIVGRGIDDSAWAMIRNDDRGNMSAPIIRRAFRLKPTTALIFRLVAEGVVILIEGATRI